MENYQKLRNVSCDLKCNVDIMQEKYSLFKDLFKRSKIKLTKSRKTLESLDNTHQT